MKWVLITSVLVIIVFVSTFFATHNTWAATNAAGIVCMVYLLIFLVWTARVQQPVKRRWWTLSIGIVSVAGTTFFWATFHDTTTWQAETLHTIHKVIFHGVSMDVLRTKGMKLLGAYSEQKPPRQLTIGEVFRKETTFANPDSSIVDVNQESNLRIFAEAVSDTHVVLVAQGILPIDGETRFFQNADGRKGMAQDRLTVTKRGVVYEIQN
jgi:hypothetical protein